MLCPWIRGITAGCCGFWGSELSQGVQGRDLNQESSVISPLNKVHWKKHFPGFHGAVAAMVSQEPSQQGLTFSWDFCSSSSLSSPQTSLPKHYPEVSPFPQAQMDPLLQPRWIPCAPAESRPGLEPRFSLAGAGTGGGWHWRAPNSQSRFKSMTQDWPFLVSAFVWHC